MALHLQHPKMTFIGTGQTVTVSGSGKNEEYVMSGAEGPRFFATAHLIVNNAKAFHGSISLGAFSDVTLTGVSASSYTYDAMHDVLRLYQGNRVVNTIHLEIDSAHIPGPWNQIRVQNAPGGVYIGDAYHGLSYGLEPHV